MAKKRGITGWHSMRKQDLIRAIVRDAKSRSTKKGSKMSNGKTTRRVSSTRQTTQAKVRSSKSRVSAKASSPTASRVARQIQKAAKQQEKLKDISGAAPKLKPRSKPKPPPIDVGKDRVVLLVRDPFWLHAHWELSSRCIQRAQAAMAESWHTARPVLRLVEVSTNSTSSTTEVHLRDIEIHGGVNNWYIDVIDPPKGYRVEIGYLASNGRFHSLARSNSVVTPRPGSCDAVDENWTDVAENCERIFALSGGYSAESASDELQEVLEERLRRPVGAPMATRYGIGAAAADGGQSFGFDVDAEMIIYGSTKADAHVTLGGEPIKLRQDGTFTVRMSMPDRRQVLPVTSSSSDGTTQQTIVLAVERNTKVMEPVLRDSSQ
jgi:hypothetical protein